MNIVLIGYRGSGKTTVGKLLADRLKMPFVDTDDLIVRRAGQNIAAIFNRHGEQKFRDLETQALNESLQQDGQILALGGGAVIREENRNALKADPQNKIFYLHHDAATLHQRIQADPKTSVNRPALTQLNGTIDEVQHLLAARLPWYREVMNHEIDTADMSPEQIVEQIVSLL
ncbi:MAG TPA: shikimate kinase [Tepidisphaeraceae bacterium]|nr:shikimate kinase [Tepidisphaeraceae bacterium]